MGRDSVRWELRAVARAKRVNDRMTFIAHGVFLEVGGIGMAAEVMQAKCIMGRVLSCFLGVQGDDYRYIASAQSLCCSCRSGAEGFLCMH